MILCVCAVQLRRRRDEQTDGLQIVRLQPMKTNKGKSLAGGSWWCLAIVGQKTSNFEVDIDNTVEELSQEKSHLFS